MNPASALMWSNTINWKIIFSYYITGLPVDLVRAIATFFFLWLIAEPMLEKLDPIKTQNAVWGVMLSTTPQGLSPRRPLYLPSPPPAARVPGRPPPSASPPLPPFLHLTPPPPPGGALPHTPHSTSIFLLVTGDEGN